MTATPNSKGRSRKAAAATTTPAPTMASQARSKRASKAAATKAAVKANRAGLKLVEEQLAAPAPAPKAPRPNAERRNELPHEDARTAVQFHSCPSCKARKAQNCKARSGEPTNHVHAGRMAKLDA